LPASVRTRLTKRLLRPGGSPWLRELVDGRVKMREGVRIREVDRSNGRLKLLLDDGNQTHADRVLVAAGYRFSLDSLSFLSPGLRSRIATKDGWPTLDRYFRSVSEPRVFFIGYAAEGRFGPISRYVLGAEFTANRVRECLD
jgi:pyruvate/2-oxoglutarate dehydrogenase complex dihydrolipoamide dehydrogenase (E3) component